MSAVAGIEEYLDSISYLPVFSLPKEKFSKTFGVSIPTIDAKISSKKWKEGEVIFRDPDGKIHILLIGYQKWVESSWRERVQKEDTSVVKMDASISSFTGTTPKPAPSISTAGRSRHVRKKVQAIRPS